MAHQHRWQQVGYWDTGTGAIRYVSCCTCGAARETIAVYAVGRGQDATYIHAAGTPRARELHPSYQEG